ncbi:MAG: DNA polymerase III subunit delta [Alphaproteobacteria bacterium]|nr:DNA polymerase III subunit delta [Alphaproteobacteria bacterium]
MKYKDGDFLAAARGGLASVAGLLIYGEDKGKVQEFMSAAVKAACPVDDGFSIFELDALDFKTVEDLAAAARDEMNSISLMGGRKVVKIKNAPADLAAAGIAPLDPAAGILILAAENLSPGSELRRSFENDAGRLAAIACYVDDDRTIRDLARKALAEFGIRAVPLEVMDFIVSYLGENRATSRMELEKIGLYLSGKTSMTMEDAEACLMDSSLLAVADLGGFVASGDVKKVSSSVVRLLGEGNDANYLVASVRSHFWRLFDMVKEIEAGADIDAVAARQFWKVRDSYRRQLGALSCAKITNIIARLGELENQIRTNHAPGEVFVAQALLGISAGLRNK